jgi:hypothetical protein
MTGTLAWWPIEPGKMSARPITSAAIPIVHLVAIVVKKPC